MKFKTQLESIYEMSNDVKSHSHVMKCIGGGGIDYRYRDW